MKLFSIKNLASQTGNTLSRFPLTIVIATFGTFLAIHLADQNKSFTEVFREANLLHTSILGLSLSIATTLFAEQRQFNLTLKILINVLIVTLLILYFLYLPNNPTQIHYMRAALLFVAFHFLLLLIYDAYY